jgi:prophage regulatory protein
MPTHNEFPRTGFVRLRSILAPEGPIPVSKSTWWTGVKDGRFPAPVKLGKGTTVWRAEEIRALYELIDQAELRSPGLGMSVTSHATKHALLGVL